MVLRGQEVAFTLPPTIAALAARHQLLSNAAALPTASHHFLEYFIVFHNSKNSNLFFFPCILRVLSELEKIMGSNNQTANSKSKHCEHKV